MSNRIGPGRFGDPAMNTGAMLSRLCRAAWRSASSARLLALATALTTAAIAQPQQASAQGWTRFLPSSDTRVVYVSSSQGSDNNSGLSSQSPVQSLNKGMSLMRNGYPDWILLRRGDVWYETMNWNKSGRSEDEPMRMAAYGPGTARPKLRTSGSGFTAGNSRSNVAITSIHFESEGGGSDGMRIVLNYGENWLVEDCVIDGYKDNLNIQGFGTPGVINNFKLRRSVITNAASTGGGHSQGLYADRVHGLLIDGCVFDHNGWSQVSNPSAPGYPTIYSHSCYIQTGCTGLVFRRNIVANSSSHGLQARPGGIVENNVFIRNPIAILFGGGDPDPQTHTYGITGTVRGNLILDGKDISPTLPRGFAIDLFNVASAVVENNIAAHQTLGSQRRAVSFEGTAYGSGVGVHNVQLRNNIFYKWGGSIRLVGGSSNFSNLNIAQNDFQVFDGSYIVDHNNSGSVGPVQSASNQMYTNRSSSQWCLVASSSQSLNGWKNLVSDTSSVGGQADYPNPDRTIATYHASLGGSPSYEAFIAEARQQSKFTWRNGYYAPFVISYFRQGFGW
jgi:hypothetical protein